MSWQTNKDKTKQTNKKRQQWWYKELQSHRIAQVHVNIGLGYKGSAAVNYNIRNIYEIIQQLKGYSSKKIKTT